MELVAFPEELLERAKRGETSAFQELYARARAFAYRVGVTHFELRREDAEDISQEVTWSLHRNLSMVERPDAWLFAAVRNHVRRLRREPAFEGLRVAEQAVRPGAEWCADLWDCILRLSVVCRRLILHLFFWGYTERELSLHLRVHHVTVHQRKRKCFGILFKIYEGDHDVRGMLPSRRDPGSRGKRASPEPVRDLP